jgi:alkylation response protein AidB-like acyl-CoA dehydrogenase
MSAITNRLALMAEVETLRRQLAETHAHLEAQRQATYQAVEREHAAKAALADVQGSR